MTCSRRVRSGTRDRAARRRSYRRVAEEPESAVDGRPVNHRPNEFETTRKVVEALAKADKLLYQKDDALVEVIRPAGICVATAPPRIVSLTAPNIRTRITAAVELRNLEGAGTTNERSVPTNPRPARWLGEGPQPLAGNPPARRCDWPSCPSSGWDRSRQSPGRPADGTALRR